MSTPAVLKIVYFGVRAKAEATRMILSHAGIPFADLTVQEHYGAGWKEIKESDRGPIFNQLPMLIADGTEIVQSGSMVRYAARLANLVPTDPLEAAKVDMLFELAQELSPINAVTNVRRGDVFAEQKKTFFEDTLPSRLKALAKVLGDQEFFSGKAPMYCDFGIYHKLDLCRLVHPPSLDEYGNIVKWMRRIEKLKRVDEYLKTRPDVVDIGVRPMLEPTADPTSVQSENRIFNPNR